MTTVYDLTPPVSDSLWPKWTVPRVRRPLLIVSPQWPTKSPIGASFIARTKISQPYLCHARASWNWFRLLESCPVVFFCIDVNEGFFHLVGYFLYSLRTYMFRAVKCTTPGKLLNSVPGSSLLILQPINSYSLIRKGRFPKVFYMRKALRLGGAVVEKRDQDGGEL